MIVKKKKEAELWENVWYHHEKGKAEFKDVQTVTVNKVNVDKAVEPWRTAYLVLGSGQDPGQTSIYQRLHLLNCKFKIEESYWKIVLEKMVAYIGCPPPVKLPKKNSSKVICPGPLKWQSQVSREKKKITSHVSLECWWGLKEA